MISGACFSRSYGKRDMLSSYNARTPRLLNRLFGRRGHTEAPNALTLRTAIVRHNLETTFVVPGDWPKENGEAWFHDGQPPAQGSEVQYLIDGPMTFQAMGEAIKTADSKGHFVVLLGWSLNHETEVAGTTFLKLIRDVALLGVAVRILLFDNVEMPSAGGGFINREASAALNELRRAENLDVYCCLDDNTQALTNSLVSLPDQDVRDDVWPEEWESQPRKYLRKGNVTSFGSHHHKIILVYGNDGLVGFCGGIDFDPNRNRMLHDVHVRVTGDAAKGLLEIAQQRWAASSDSGVRPTPATLTVPALAAPAGAAATSHLARVVQTVGNPDLTKRIPNTLWPAVRHAIQHATRFIYIEDQYFWSMDLVFELLKAAKRVKHITVLLPPALWGEHAYKRQQAIGLLAEQAKRQGISNIGLYQADAPGHQYVHSKMFIFDDEYAIVGSANANNRGYFLDSEASVGVAERSWNAGGTLRQGAWFATEANFARRLRIELWSEHLGLEPEELFDGVGAVVHWHSPPPSLVSAYHAVNLRKSSNAHTDSDRLPWLEAPYADWSPEPPGYDRLVDPKDVFEVLRGRGGGPLL